MPVVRDGLRAPSKVPARCRTQDPRAHRYAEAGSINGMHTVPEVHQVSLGQRLRERERRVPADVEGVERREDPAYPGIHRSGAARRHQLFYVTGARVVDGALEIEIAALATGTARVRTHVVEIHPGPVIAALGVVGCLAVRFVAAVRQCGGRTRAGLGLGRLRGARRSGGQRGTRWRR
jgi:hypothetical protein